MSGQGETVTVEHDGKSVTVDGDTFSKLARDRGFFEFVANLRDGDTKRALQALLGLRDRASLRYQAQLVELGFCGLAKGAQKLAEAFDEAEHEALEKAAPGQGELFEGEEGEEPLAEETAALMRRSRALAVAEALVAMHDLDFGECIKRVEAAISGAGDGKAAS